MNAMKVSHIQVRLWLLPVRALLAAGAVARGALLMNKRRQR